MSSLRVNTSVVFSKKNLKHEDVELLLLPQINWYLDQKSKIFIGLEKYPISIDVKLINFAILPKISKHTRKARKDDE